MLRFSLITLILWNVVPLVGVWFFGWDRWSIVFLYWMKSTVIGVYAVLKMLLAEVVPKRPIARLGTQKFIIILFFMIHFSGFVLVHLALLTGAHFFITRITGVKQSMGSIFNTMLSGDFSMFLSHGFSFVMNHWLGKEYEEVTPGEMMISPYPRVVLMQFISLFFVFFAPEVVMVFFKTIFNIIGHLLERRLFRKK